MVQKAVDTSCSVDYDNGSVRHACILWQNIEENLWNPLRIYFQTFQKRPSTTYHLFASFICYEIWRMLTLCLTWCEPLVKSEGKICIPWLSVIVGKVHLDWLVPLYCQSRRNGILKEWSTVLYQHSFIIRLVTRWWLKHAKTLIVFSYNIDVLMTCLLVPQLVLML